MSMYYSENMSVYNTSSIVVIYYCVIYGHFVSVIHEFSYKKYVYTYLLGY